MQLTRRELLLGSLLPLTAAAPYQPPTGRHSARLKALLIGIDAYTYARPLKNAVSDVRSVAEALEGLGYQTSVVENPTDTRLRAELEHFCGSITEQDAVVLHFAGHGIQMGGSSVLLARDAKGDPTGEVPLNSLPLSELLQMIADKYPRQCIALVDACRDEPSAGISVGTPGLASINAPVGFFVAFSAGSGQLALDSLGDGDASPNSVFTRELLKNLSASRTIDAIMKDTRDGVRRLTHSIAHPQTPAFYSQVPYDLRLNGSSDPSAASASVATDVQIRNTDALVVSVPGVVQRSGSVLELPGASNDGEYVARGLAALGLKPRLLENPTRSEFEEAVKGLGTAGQRKLLYIAGAGTFDGSDSEVYLRPTKDSPLPAHETDGVPLGRIARLLAGTKGDTIIFLDTGLPPATLESSGFLTDMTWEHWLPDPQSSGRPEIERRKGGGTPLGPRIAVVSSCNFYQGGLDQASGAVNSPFALAFDNAIARPNEKLFEIFEVIRREVETMTGGVQTPVLFWRGAAVRDVVITELLL